MLFRSTAVVLLVSVFISPTASLLRGQNEEMQTSRSSNSNNSIEQRKLEIDCARVGKLDLGSLTPEEQQQVLDCLSSGTSTSSVPQPGYDANGGKYSTMQCGAVQYSLSTCRVRKQ